MGLKGARGLIPVFSKKKASWTWKMSFEQQIPERDRNVRLYSNRGRWWCEAKEGERGWPTKPARCLPG